MSILIEALKGRGKDEWGDETLEADTGVDAIYLTKAGKAVPKRVGIVGRHPGSPICLLQPLSESLTEEIRRKVSERSNAAAGPVTVAPKLEKQPK